MLTVLMYHYVRDYSVKGHYNLKGMDVTDFSRQISTLVRNGGIITLSELNEFFTRKRTSLTGKYLLTFDDGLKDSYNYILPILRKYKVTGTFHIITKAVEESFVPISHKIHLLMGSLGYQQFEKECLIVYRENFFSDFWKYLDEDRVNSSYRWDKPEVKRFKWELNFGLPDTERVKVVNTIFDLYFDEAEISNSLFLNWEEVKEIEKEHNFIGGHTHSHADLGSLTNVEQHSEISACTTLLNQKLNDKLKPFSYPFGKSYNFNDDSISLLKRSGYCCGFSNIVGINNDNLINNQYKILRIDPKDVDIE